MKPTSDPSELNGTDQLGLRSLLAAVIAIGSQLDLDAVLHEIVSTAAGLAGAQYAALGILGSHDEWRLSQFITVGIEGQVRDQIGELPHGRGVLGLLIDDPQAIRLTDIAEHSASYGFPPNHPPMRTFLGMPVLVRGEVYGNLYLTEKRGGGEFTPADEQILLALATAAGLAIQNARLFEEGQLKQRWLEVTSDITTRLLGGATTNEVLPALVAGVRELAEADTAFLALPHNGDETLCVRFADGAGAADLINSILPKESFSALVMTSGRAESIADTRLDPRVWQGVFETAGAGPALFVPLGAQSASLGTLVVANHIGGQRFSGETVQLIASFAGQAAIALRLGTASQDRESLALLSDRDRIARDLHDLTIQRLFATGVSLQGAIRNMAPPSSVERVLRAVDNLDDTIKEIRTTIFSLQSPAASAEDGLRASVLSASQAASSVLGFRPHVVFDGLLETLLPQDIAEHMLAVLREALSNVARHAQATRVGVRVSVTADLASLEVIDNGIGIPTQGRRSGLSNMASRALELGGDFTTEVASADGGSRILWQVPLHHVNQGAIHD